MAGNKLLDGLDKIAVIFYDEHGNMIQLLSDMGSSQIVLR
jgi:hypothetical protein